MSSFARAAIVCGMDALFKYQPVFAMQWGIWEEIHSCLDYNGNVDNTLAGFYVLEEEDRPWIWRYCIWMSRKVCQDNAKYCENIVFWLHIFIRRKKFVEGLGRKVMAPILSSNKPACHVPSHERWVPRVPRYSLNFEDEWHFPSLSFLTFSFDASQHPYNCRICKPSDSKINCETLKVSQWTHHKLLPNF